MKTNIITKTRRAALGISDAEAPGNDGHGRRRAARGRRRAAHGHPGGGDLEVSAGTTRHVFRVEFLWFLKLKNKEKTILGILDNFEMFLKISGFSLKIY